jgi:uncharacterized protein YukE
MPGGQIRVTPEQLASVASQRNGGASSIDGILSQLAGRVRELAGLVEATGSAEAAAAYTVDVGVMPAGR